MFNKPCAFHYTTHPFPQFKAADLDSLLSPIQRYTATKVKITAIYPQELYACKVYISSQKSTPYICCTALIDTGSSYTIANKQAATLLGCRDIDKLPSDSNIGVGLDNNPIVVSS